MSPNDKVAAYEDFGAIGDGVADDLPAICAAHAHANQQGLRVRSKADATYHLGSRALTAAIETDTDWNTSRFTIDDTQAEDHRKPLFEVRSSRHPESLRIERLARDQRSLDVRPADDCFVWVQSDRQRRYIRRGPNQNRGVPQQDCFILRRDGSIEGDIDWDYKDFTDVAAQPLDTTPLVLRGGVFTTFANRMRQDIGYNYWARNIVVGRSNTTVEGLTHYVVGETSVGHPYRGFLSVQRCANVTLRDCFATGHKIYSTIGSAGKPVNMGSYDYAANSVVNFRMVGCRMNHILDRTRWGVIGTNFCKNILLEDCVLSRMDTHMGVSGTYAIRRCTLGHMGLNAIGRGQLIVENSALHGVALVSLRGDYGSTWEGDVVIRNCRWMPACGDRHALCMIHASNDGMHDFGYACTMPRSVDVDGLFVDDANHPDGYEELYVFTHPDGTRPAPHAGTPPDERPFPYGRCRSVRLRGLTTAGGKRPRLAPDGALDGCAVLNEED
jgi:hypothetical protein